MAIPALFIAGLLAGVAGGWTWHDVEEFHNSFVLTNAVVDSQNGVYVTYHFEDDPERQQRTLKFCSDYVPDFQPRQIIAEMVYTRKKGCESIANRKFGVVLRRVNGEPVLDGGE